MESSAATQIGEGDWTVLLRIGYHHCHVNLGGQQASCKAIWLNQYRNLDLEPCLDVLKISESTSYTVYISINIVLEKSHICSSWSLNRTWTRNSVIARSNLKGTSKQWSAPRPQELFSFTAKAPNVPIIIIVERTDLLETNNKCCRNKGWPLLEFFVGDYASRSEESWWLMLTVVRCTNCWTKPFRVVDNEFGLCGLC